MDASTRSDRLQKLVASERALSDDLLGTARVLHQVCRVAVRITATTGATVSLMTDDGPSGVIASSDDESASIVDVQFTIGEGPCWDAYALDRPVLAADLLGGEDGPWSSFGAAMSARGVRAAFAFPLHVGAARLGVLEILRDRPGALADEECASALALAEIATRTLLAGQEDVGADGTPRGLTDALESQFAIYQAQGMVMMQLGVPLTDAMSRLRAHAYVNDRTLGAVARDIVSRTLSLDRDER